MLNSHHCFFLQPGAALAGIVLDCGRGACSSIVSSRALLATSRQTAWWGWHVWGRLLAPCEGAQLSIVVELVLVVFFASVELLKVELVAHDGANATKAHDELIALAGTIRDKLERGAKVLVVFGQPF